MTNFPTASTPNGSDGASHGWGDFLRSVRRVPPAIVPGFMAAAVL